MAGNGGYIKPSNPSSVSGIGSASQRTDGNPSSTMKGAAMNISGEKYGQNQALQNVQSDGNALNPTAAPSGYTPMSQADVLLAGQPSFSRASERPNESLSEGASWGPGKNFNELGLGSGSDGVQNRDALLGLFSALKQAVERPNATPATRQTYLRIAAQVARMENQ